MSASTAGALGRRAQPSVPALALGLAAILSGIATANPAAGAPARAPGMPALTFRADELFKTVGTLPLPAGASYGNGTFFQGHLLLGIDVDEDSAGLQMWDISDPRSPKLARQKYDTETRRLREIQNWAFSRDGDRWLAAIPSHAGLEIWDFTRVLEPKRVGAVALAPGGGKGIYNGIISAAWSGPYIYCGGMNTGLHVVDARDPAAPKPVKRLENSVLAGGLGGPVFVVGGLLVATTMVNGSEPCAVSTFDLADPASPRLLDLHRCAEGLGSYTAFLGGDRIYGQGVDGRLHVFPLTPGGAIGVPRSAATPVARGGYGMLQDGFVHAGMSDRYVKYDIRGGLPVETGRYNVAGDNDWVVPLGNLAFVGDDDGVTIGALTAHQARPDSLGPRVELAVPAPGARGQALAGRVGVSLSDNVDPLSVDSAAFTLRPVGGEPLPGRLSVLMGTVNFAPSGPLLPGTLYEARLAGLRDWAGNPMPRDTAWRFTTAGTSALGRPAAGGAEVSRARRLAETAARPAVLRGARDPLGRRARSAAGER